MRLYTVRSLLGDGHQVVTPVGSDHASMDMAPSPAVPGAQGPRDRVVGLFVVRARVLPGRVAEARHPAARQASDKDCLVSILGGAAFLAGAGLGRYGREHVKMLTTGRRAVRAHAPYLSALLVPSGTIVALVPSRNGWPSPTGHLQPSAMPVRWKPGGRARLIT